MTSFYGGGGLASGSGGSSSYDDLTGAPLKKLESSESPIILSELSDGLYSITGVYFYTPDGLEQPAVIDKLIQVERDTLTNSKIVKFDSFEDGKYYIVTLTCKADGTVITDKLLVKAGTSSIISEVASKVELSTF